MGKPASNTKILIQLEVALYSAGRPLTLDELIKASDTDSKARVIELLDLLIKKTKSTFKGLEFAILPDKTYVFQVRPEYGQLVRRFATKPLLAKATLKTLSYIAYMQPISSKQLVETRGNSVYTHLKELLSLDYISIQNVGRLKIYSTTPRFQKYFGITGDAESLRNKLFKNRRSS